MRWLIPVTVVAACSSGKGTPPPKPDTKSDVTTLGEACAADGDCVITNFASCCACPSCEIGPPTARSVTGLEQAKDQCRLVKCNPTSCAMAGECAAGEPADHFEPRCSNGKCAGVRLPTGK